MDASKGLVLILVMVCILAWTGMMIFYERRESERERKREKKK